MSGGSFGYLVYRFLDLYPDEDLIEMAEALEEGSPERLATERIIEHFNQIREEASDDLLQGVWKAVEWKCSGDWGQDRVDAAISAYRNRAAKEEEAESIDVTFKLEHNPPGSVLVRMMIDGNQRATASASRLFNEISREDFDVSLTDVVGELKEALLARAKGEDKRVTMLMWENIYHGNYGHFVGRVLSVENEHMEGHMVHYNMETGETGPPETQEYVRNHFRRAIHEAILK